jgi:hypothetical protein
MLLCVSGIVQRFINQRGDFRKLLGKVGKLFDQFVDFGFRADALMKPFFKKRFGGLP